MPATARHAAPRSAAAQPAPASPAAMPKPQRRIMAVWLPLFATDRLVRRGLVQGGGPFTTVRAENGRSLLTALNRTAAEAGLRPGMPLADARAMLPELRNLDADPVAEARDLAGLAAWAVRYTPAVVPDVDGLLLDVGGSAHLFGGETGMVADIAARLDRIGFAHRIAIAPTAAAARAFARHGNASPTLVGAEALAAALAALPVEALGISPEVASGLVQLGLRRIGQVADLPRAPLAARFGTAPLERLDAALGRSEEALAPHRPPSPWRLRLDFAEPIGTAEDVELVAKRLVTALCPRLEQKRRGVRRLELSFFGLDGTVQRAAFGTVRPVRDIEPLLRLLHEPLAGLDLSSPFETVILDAPLTEPLAHRQIDLPVAAQAAAERSPEAVGALVDRLVQRLGPNAVGRQVPRESHLPERAVRHVPALPLADRTTVDGWPAGVARPTRLFERPEPVEATAPRGDSPPDGFRWRGVSHKIRRAEGPERVAPEWWREPTPAETGTRDYYRVEDEDGRRFWLFRAGLPGVAPQPGWYLHGLFS